MQIDVLKEFVALSRSLNFTQTAKKLFISQSVLSKHINLLEKELGVALLVRTQHHVTLTTAGLVLQQELDSLLPMLDAALCKAKECSNGSSLIKLGYLHGASQGYLSTAYRNFAESHPDIDIQLTMMEQVETLAALDNEEIDLALTSTCGYSLNGEYRTRLLFVDDFGVLVNKAHRLASHSLISIDDLRNERIYISGGENAPLFSRYIEKRLSMLGFANPEQCRVADVNSLPIAVLDDPDGVTLVPNHFSEICSNNELAVVPLSDGFMQMDILLAWRDLNQTQALLELVEAIAASCALHRKSLISHAPAQKPLNKVFSPPSPTTAKQPAAAPGETL